jgi:hypothetical protein
MHRYVAIVIAAIALATPLTGCGGGGSAASRAAETAARAREAASRAAEPFDDARQIYKTACDRVKIHQYSQAAQGDYRSDDDPPIC